MKESKKPGRPPANPSKQFNLGALLITVSGSKEDLDALKFESRHNFLQMAIGEGELRERGGAVAPATDSNQMSDMIAAVRELASRAPGGDSIPSVGPGRDHVLSDKGLRAVDEIGAHLDDVTRSVGGF